MDAARRHEPANPWPEAFGLFFARSSMSFFLVGHRSRPGRTGAIGLSAVALAVVVVACASATTRSEDLDPATTARRRQETTSATAEARPATGRSTTARRRHLPGRPPKKTRASTTPRLGARSNRAARPFNSPFCGATRPPAWPCAPGLVCTQNACTKAAPAGTSCGQTRNAPDPCDGFNGVVCDVFAMRCVQVKVVPTGQACDPTRDVCAGDGDCDGTCLPPLEEGSDCRATGPSCLAPATCDRGTCVVPSADTCK